MRTPHLLTLFCLLFITVIAISGCKKDDDNPGVSNEFTINGDTRALSQGFIESFGSNGNGSFDFDITLISDGLTINGVGDFAGAGDFLYFDLNTNSDAGLVEGTYTFSANREAFSFVDGNIALNLDVATTNSDGFFTVTSGTVDIELAGTETIITFNVQLTDGITSTSATGSFRGVLRPI